MPLSGNRAADRASVGPGTRLGLGDVLIVDVGYNESSVGYRAGIDQIMRAAEAGHEALFG